MYEYGTLKPVEVISRRGAGEEGGKNGGINQTRVQCMYIWKWHNRTPFITIIY
jgi:hypothetical protein